MSISKNHHYVPRVILKNFIDSNKRYYYYDKDHPERGYQYRSTRSTFCEPHLNTISNADSSIDISVEADFFQKRESKWGIILKKIKQDFPNFSRLSADEEALLKDLTFRQFMRSIDRIQSSCSTEEIEDLYDTKVGQLHNFGLFHPKYYKSETKQRIIKNGKINALAMDPLSEVSKYFDRTKIILARQKNTKKRFIIGSSPVVSLSSTYDKDCDVEMYLPISEQAAIGIVSRKFRIQFLDLDDTEIRKINLCICNASSKIASAHKTLIQSLINNR
ncbi:MAG: DUF4238 domain-containing protein [Sneathiella sp.]